MSLYIIQKGAVSIRVAKDRAFVELAKISNGEVIGELAFFDRKPRSASAVILVDAEILEVPFDSLEKIYATVPGYMKTIMGSIVERLRHANDTIKKLQKTHKSDGDENKASGTNMSAQDVLDAAEDLGIPTLFGNSDSNKPD